MALHEQAPPGLIAEVLELAATAKATHERLMLIAERLKGTSVSRVTVRHQPRVSGEQPSPDHVRNALVVLCQDHGSATVKEVAARANVQPQYALKYLNQMEKDGQAVSIRDGSGGRKHFAPVRPNIRSVEDVADATVTHIRRGLPIAGTGRGLRTPDAGVLALIQQCKAKGAQVNQLANLHYEVRWQGKKIGSIPHTPSDHRALSNTRAEIRRNGLLI